MGTVEDFPCGFYISCMKYHRWYDQIIERARTRKLDVYHETHHIIPRAFGGSDDPANLVDLTYREHFLVHWLLTKIYTGYQRRLMAYALHCMTFDIRGNRSIRLIAGWQHEVAKRSLKHIALEALERRRSQQRAKNRQRRQEIEVRAAKALIEAPALNPARWRDRGTLKQMTTDWFRFYPIRNRKRQRSAGYPRPNVDAKY